MMQCGYPGAGPVTIALPSAERLPARLARRDLLVDGHAARGVVLSGHTLTITLAPAPRIICDVIGLGRLTVEVTAGAELGSPLHAGTYTITASISSASPPPAAFSASFTLRSN
jgi:hypothetical protein